MVIHISQCPQNTEHDLLAPAAKEKPDDHSIKQWQPGYLGERRRRKTRGFPSLFFNRFGLQLKPF